MSKREDIARIIEPNAWDVFDKSTAPYKGNRGSIGDENFWYQRTWGSGCRTVNDVYEWWLSTTDVLVLDVYRWRESLLKADKVLEII